ncbi:MAG: alpha/beta hydrolase fold domain-containing protein [Streptosporangiaceae bacterium]
MISHPATDSDLRAVTRLVADVHGSADSGAELLSRLGPPETAFATRPFRSGSLRGEWVAAPASRNDGVLLYLHGRRFQFDEPPGIYAAQLAAATRLPVLLLQYRLAPEHPYPAALDDVLEAYQALLDQGTPPSRIILAGHSAGATLVLSALLGLRAAGRPLPAAAVALSPMTDFTLGSESLAANEHRDLASVAELSQIRSAYLGAADPAGAPQSPLAGECAGLPPMLIACGSAEILRDDAVRFAGQAEAAGVPVELHEFEAMPHGFPILDLDAARILLGRVAQFTAERISGLTGPPQGSLSIRRIGWAGYEITTEYGTRVLVDPYLSGSEGIHRGIPESPVPLAELTGVDAIVVTHAGYDHRGQALELALAGQATLVCGSALARAALSAGLPPSRLAVTVSGVEVWLRDVTLKSLPAQHESTMTVDGGFAADQPQSFLLTTAAGTRVFCGGDTSLTGDLRTWGEVYRPGIAVLGIGGLWLGAGKIVELYPAEAAVAARWLGAPTVLTVHHRPNDPAPAQLAAELAGEAVDVISLDFGETWTPTDDAPAGCYGDGRG